MTQNTTHKTIDIVTLVEKNPITRLSIDYQNSFVEKLQKNFDDDDQKLFIASFYCYLNHNESTDFVIELNDIWKWLGFSRVDHCKRLLDKYFIKDIDYKIILPNMGENSIIQNTDLSSDKAAPELGGAASLIEDINFFPPKGGEKKYETRGRPKETILMNIVTFKKLCLKSNTKRADKIHDYFIKLEKVLHEIISQEAENLRNQLEQKIQNLQNKPQTIGFYSRKPAYIYIIKDKSKFGHYKIGLAVDVVKRLRSLNTSSSEKTLRIVHKMEVYDGEMFEKTIHYILQPFNIRGRREWFYFENENEIDYVKYIFQKIKDTLNEFEFKTYDSFIDSVQLMCDDKDDNDNNTESTDHMSIHETNIYKLNRQRSKNRTGRFKGVCWCVEKNKWKAELKRDYTISFLGYFDLETEAAIAYNDYVLYLNNQENCNYIINDIDNYKPNPRDIPSQNKINNFNKKSSHYTGVTYNKNRDVYQGSIKYAGKNYFLGSNKEQIECAKLYNKQAAYFNSIDSNTNYILNRDINVEPENILKDRIYKFNENKSSIYRGVLWSKIKNKWRSVIVINKKQHLLGFYVKEIEAALVYNEVASKQNELKKQNKTGRLYKLNEFN